MNDFLSLDSCRIGEGIKIALPEVIGRTIEVFSHEIVDQHLAEPAQFPQAPFIPRNLNSQIQKFQTSFKSQGAVFIVPQLPLGTARYLFLAGNAQGCR